MSQPPSGSGNLQLPHLAFANEHAGGSPQSSGGLSKTTQMSYVSTPASSEPHRSGRSATSTRSDMLFHTRAQTILIFDWDDTLCPSSYLKRHNLRVLDEEVVVGLFRFSQRFT